MQTLATHHRFMLIDDLTDGRSYVSELMAEDAARLYPAELQSLLAMGQTVRIGDVLHCDMRAFIAAHRQLPEAMTRRPRPVALCAPEDAPQIGYATDEATLTGLVVVLPRHSAAARRAVAAVS